MSTIIVKIVSTIIGKILSWIIDSGIDSVKYPKNKKAIEEAVKDANETKDPKKVNDLFKKIN